MIKVINKEITNGTFIAHIEKDGEHKKIMMQPARMLTDKELIDSVRFYTERDDRSRD